MRDIKKYTILSLEFLMDLNNFILKSIEGR